MATRMLIDARHSEETRVAVLKGNRIEEFDFESAEHKQIKGNIYLAKVTRVEPSLQAAFVEFGGNRHGFLAFGEIHPDYYQIPQQDREALLAEEQAHAEEEAALRAEEEDEEDDSFDGESAEDRLADDEALDSIEEIDDAEAGPVATIEDGHVENGDTENGEFDGDEAEDDDGSEDESGEDGTANRSGRGRGRGRRQGRGNQSDNGGANKGGGNRAREMDALREKRQALRRRYKIQDVIQRRQVLLVQVVKEERGNKGAALTTYLSLAGRYCVLMPNSSHGGGISRKISSGSDRKRLKQIVGELSLPRSMGLIVRTAGLQRTKPEIKRDFDYLARLWDEIRENTMASSAPALIHSDSDLVKRAIRDIYNKEIEEVVVEGGEGYRSARSFMKLLMPSHVRKVTAYSDPVPLFQRYGAEDELSAMYDPVVQLKSGGYLVINPTEALVSIDINSGRSTKEHGIEATALSTNLEAAREIARQLRLRDMAGLVVIDFIDMEYGANIRKVEKAMKDALRNDRARIQVGRISGFGLMEMSRQRLRTGVLEATTRSCPHCDGTGLVRTASSAGLSALRMIEDEASKGRGTTITLFASTEAAVYLLNAKRADLAEIESRYGVLVEVFPEGEDEGAKMRAISSGPRPTVVPRFDPIIDEDDDVLLEEDLDEEIEEDEDAEEEAAEAPRSRPASNDDEADEGGRKKRRRRRRGGRNRTQTERESEDGSGESGEDEESDEDAPAEIRAEAQEERATGDEDGDNVRKRRRRGGRRRRRSEDEGTQDPAQSAGQPDEAQPAASDKSEDAVGDIAVLAELPETATEPAIEEQKPKRRGRPRKQPEGVEGTATAAPETADEAAAEVPEKPKRSRRRKADSDESAASDAVANDAEPAEKPKRPRRRKAAESKEAASKAQPDANEPEQATPQSTAEPASAASAPASTPASAPAANDANGEEQSPADGGKRRGGWWQRTFGA